MIKIIRSKDCGNSPKNKFVENIEIAIAKNDTEFLLTAIDPSIHCRIIGQKSAQGMNEFLETLTGFFQSPEIAEMTIHHVMTHGKAGSVNGSRKHKNGKIYEFCTVYEFSNAKGTSIKEITHYAIESGFNSKIK
jgi:hypothetical protein